MSLFVTVAGLFAQGFPTISTDENTQWYLIKFMNGGNALTAKADGQIATSAVTGEGSQQWKITGDETDGYTFTNKKGLVLYVDAAEKENMVKAAFTASGVSKFSITTTGNDQYSEGYEIHPKGNSEISMNLWGGPKENRGVGLWNKNDQNNPVQFTPASSIEKLDKVDIIPMPQEITVGNDVINLDNFNTISYKEEQLKEHVEAFAAQLKVSSGIELQVKAAGDAAGDGEIWFGTEANLPAEGYTLTTSEKRIEIKSSEFGGSLYG